jgi:hypothetical protein
MSSKQGRSSSPNQPASPAKYDAKKPSPPAKSPQSPPKGKAPEPVSPPKGKAPEPARQKAPEPAKPAKSAPAPKAPEAPKKGTFDAKAYAKNGVTEEEVQFAKTSFDLFDSDQGGSVDIKCTSPLMQNLKQP